MLEETVIRCGKRLCERHQCNAIANSCGSCLLVHFSEQHISKPRNVAVKPAPTTNKMAPESSSCIRVSGAEDNSKAAAGSSSSPSTARFREADTRRTNSSPQILRLQPTINRLQKTCMHEHINYHSTREKKRRFLRSKRWSGWYMRCTERRVLLAAHDGADALAGP
jgi:hypothetical protein